MPLLAMGTGKPRVILGLMTFGPDAAAGARITSLPDYNNFLDHLQGAGYNEVDTARSYGQYYSMYPRFWRVICQKAMQQSQSASPAGRLAEDILPCELGVLPLKECSC